MRYLVTLLPLFFVVSCVHSNTKEQSSKPRTFKSAAEIPVEEFFRNPALNGYRISPDGKKLALLRPWKNRMNIFVHPIDNPSKAKQVTFVEDRDINQVYWKGSDYVLYERDTGGDENYHVFAVNIKTGTVKDLTPFPKTRADLVDDLEDSSATDVMIQHNHRDKELFDLFRINVETGESQMVGENKQNIDSWLIDHAGKVRGGSASDGVNTVLYFEKTKGKGFEPIFKTDFRNQLGPIAFTADNQRLFVSSNLGRNLTAIFEIDPTQPIKLAGKKPLFTHNRYDIAGADYSPVRKTLGNITVITDRREVTFLHPDDQKDWDQLKARFPKEGLLLANDSSDERFWVFKTLSDLSRGSYYLYDRKEAKLTDLGSVSPWIQPELMSEMKTVNYKSRDGLTIQGYLTLPRGKEPKNLPVVIIPHGGPWHRDQWGFNSEAQLLASRGYAVFQPNFRGSTGYGRKFWEASFKQWGKNMQNDITDGVKWLIKTGVADAKKVCIYGGSYGGYTTLAGIAFTPDLYACAVDYVGVSHLFTFMKTIPPYWKPFLEMMYVMVGHPENDKALLRSASPVFFADRIKAPLFVAQGANDPRVAKAESDQIVEALRKRGVEVEYMVKDNEGHGFRNEENRFDFYRAMEKFLAKHLSQGA